MRHLLKKQVLDLKIAPSLDAFTVQHNMSSHYWKYILPILEKIFDEAGDTNRVIKIDRLEVDLGILTRENVDHATWEATFTNELEQKLRSQFQLAVDHTKNRGEPQEVAAFNQWLYYMKNGYLPWNHADFKIDQTAILETLATEYASISELRKLILSDKVALSRIIFQHNDGFLRNLVTVLTSKNQEGLPEFVTKILTATLIYPKPGSKPAALTLYRIKNEIWQYIFAIAAKEQQLSLEQIKQHVYLKFVTGASHVDSPAQPPQPNEHPPGEEEGRHDEDVAKNKNTLPGNPADSTTSPGETSNTSPGIVSKAKSLSEIANDPAGDQLPGNRDSDVSENESSDHSSPDPESQQKETSELEDGVYVNLAGLVLVHPFLSHLFKNLNWVVNGKFISSETQQQALYLLHYIASGKTEAEEYDLVTAKVLCAYPLQMPVAKALVIDDDAMQEADKMLEALISQWEILKQTSPDGLRQGFFQRNGKLFSRNEKLCLQVESKGIDVLLDRLPWNLSIIKLPWMKNILTIEWR
ncbi:MAG: hypothetical protein JNK79_00430 [Chitinophagaceae bacterium]|nr:hypothetical protein [Chitinophagaceae bacterium]